MTIDDTRAAEVTKSLAEFGGFATLRARKPQVGQGLGRVCLLLPASYCYCRPTTAFLDRLLRQLE